jgi:replicative DNA helicase
MDIEQLILTNLIHDEQFARQVLPFLKDEYFTDNIDETVFDLINEYATKYNKFPSQDVLEIELGNKYGLSEEIATKSLERIKQLTPSKDINYTWLIDTTEKFCQLKAVTNAMYNGIKIIEESKKDGSEALGPLLKIIQDAKVAFDNSIGTDFLEDADKLWEHLHQKEVLVPFDLEYFNKITGGGLSKKTLNIALAGTNVGKSLFMCHQAAASLSAGFNVLYITLEMAEEKIQKRIAGNLFDVPLDELQHLSRDMFDKKYERLNKKTNGKLIIKEYPTAGAGAAHFRHVLNELKLKKSFTPDIIFIDYLNICISTRLKMGSNVNSYTYIKSIAEELRGLAVEFNVPIMSATQTTRSGHSSTDLELDDTSESFGLPATADFMFGLSTSDELEALGQIMVKQLKARDHDKKTIKRFVIGVDYSKMRLYDVEQQAQKDITDGPVMDRTDFGQQDYERVATPKPFNTKKVFKGFK